MKIPGIYKVVPVADVVPNNWNPNKMTEDLLTKEIESIKRFGFVAPILVRQKNTSFEIIDGEHRYQAVIKIGNTDIPVIDLGQVSDDDAMQLTIVLNHLHGEPEPDLLAELMSQISLPTSDLAAVLPWSEVEIDSLIGLYNTNYDDFAEKGKDPTQKHTSGDTRKFQLGGIKGSITKEVSDELGTLYEKASKEAKTNNISETLKIWIGWLNAGQP